MLRTTSLRGWTAADATHLHHTIFINTANLFAGMQVTLTCRVALMFFPPVVGSNR